MASVFTPIPSPQGGGESSAAISSESHPFDGAGAGRGEIRRRGEKKCWCAEKIRFHPTLGNHDLRRQAQAPDIFRIGRWTAPEGGGSSHQHIGASGNGQFCGVVINAAIDLKINLLAKGIDTRT